MRPDVDLDDRLLAQASEATGVTEPRQLLHDALRALIDQENARAIIAMGGSDPDAWIPERRRTSEQ